MTQLKKATVKRNIKRKRMIMMKVMDMMVIKYIFNNLLLLEEDSIYN